MVASFTPLVNASSDDTSTGAVVVVFVVSGDVVEELFSVLPLHERSHARGTLDHGAARAQGPVHGWLNCCLDLIRFYRNKTRLLRKTRIVLQHTGARKKKQGKIYTTVFPDKKHGSFHLTIVHLIIFAISLLIM